MQIKDQLCCGMVSRRDISAHLVTCREYSQWSQSNASSLGNSFGSWSQDMASSLGNSFGNWSQGNASSLGNSFPPTFKGS